MLNAPKRVRVNVGAARQAAAGQGGGGVVQDTANTYAPRVGQWVEPHSKETECILILSMRYYKFQECAAQLHTYSKQGAPQSCDQRVWPIRALTTLFYAHD